MFDGFNVCSHQAREMEQEQNGNEQEVGPSQFMTTRDFSKHTHSKAKGKDSYLIDGLLGV